MTQPARKPSRARPQPIDPQVMRALRASGFRVSVPDASEPVDTVTARGSGGAITYRLGAGGNVVALASGSPGQSRRNRGPRHDANGNLLSSVVHGDLELFPSDIDSAAVTLTRNLRENACLRFARTAGCSMHGGAMLFQIQDLWSSMMPALGVLNLERTSGSGDADHAKVMAITAAGKLNTLASRTTRKRWLYITDMTLGGMHPPEIAQHRHVTAGVVRRELAKALDDVAKGRAK